MTILVTFVFEQIGHFHSTPSPWLFLNRRIKTIGFSHTLQSGASLVIHVLNSFAGLVLASRPLPFFDLFGFAAHAGPDFCSRGGAGTLLHDAATARAFLTSGSGHDLILPFGIVNFINFMRTV
jgi:hypothetical protein